MVFVDITYLKGIYSFTGKYTEMTKNPILPEFQEFLRVNKLAPENHIPYLALWVSRFLAFLNKSDGRDVDSVTFDFIDTLRADRNITDWQVRPIEDKSSWPCSLWRPPRSSLHELAFIS